MDIISPARVTLPAGLVVGDDIAVHPDAPSVPFVFLNQQGIEDAKWRRVRAVAIHSMGADVFLDDISAPFRFNIDQRMVFRVRFTIDPWDLASDISFVEAVVDQLQERHGLPIERLEPPAGTPEHALAEHNMHTASDEAECAPNCPYYAHRNTL